MASCEMEIQKFLPEIQPTKTQFDKAQKSHNFLRDILCTGQFEKRIVKSYLSGSYVRDTAIYPLDDVDIIFVINPGEWKTSFLESMPKPQTLLDSFHRAVKYRYPNSSVRVQRRSVGLTLSHLGIDVVPAIEQDKQGDYILIPDRIDDCWIKSAPKVHSNLSTGINQRQNGLYKPLVKLLKFWNSRLPSTAKIKSFSIETIAARLFSNTRVDSLEGGLMVFFDFVASIHGKAMIYSWPSSFGVNRTIIGRLEVQDLAETGSNVTAGIDSNRLTKFIEQAVRSLNKMIDADNAVRTETAWRRVQEALRV